MKLLYSISFALLYIREVIVSTGRIAAVIVRPNLDINPCFVEVPLTLRGEFAQFLYACLISMTPGSLSVSLDRERSVLVVHLLDARDPDTAVSVLKSSFEDPLIRIFGSK
jgi:multisubunit Na+/H+ antiporter MnhE subunit